LTTQYTSQNRNVTYVTISFNHPSTAAAKQILTSYNKYTSSAMQYSSDNLETFPV